MSCISDLSLQQTLEELEKRLQACQAELKQVKEQRDQALEDRHILEAVPDGLVLFDQQLHPTYLNLPGAQLYEQIHGNQADAPSPSIPQINSLEETLIRTVFETGQPVRIEYRAADAPNTPFIEARFVAHAIVEGKVQTVLAVLRDDTGRKRISEAQQISEHLVRAAISHAGIQVYTQDLDLCYNWIYDQQVGLLDQAYPGKTDEDFYRPEDARKLYQLKQQVLKTGLPVQAEVDLQLNGQVRSFELVILPIKNAEGNVTGIICSSLDTTERHKTMHELERLADENKAQKDLLARHNDLLQAIFDVNPAGLAVLTGKTLEHRFANPAYRSMLPHPDEDPIGRIYTDVWPQTENFRGSWILQRVMLNGNPIHFERYPQQFSDGSTHYYSISLRRLTWDNQPAVLVVMWDVTSVEAAYQRAEQAADEARLRAAEAEQGREILEAMLEYAPEGIAIANVQGQIPYLSRYGKEMASSPPVDNALTLEDQQQVWQIFHVDGATPAQTDQLPLTRATRTGEVITNEEWMLKRPNQEPRFISCNAGPIRNRSGKINGGLITWQDVTERKNFEVALAHYAERLEASNRDLEQFASVASHDLQEPLRKIQSFGTILMNHGEENGLPENKREYLSRMVDAAQRMQRMMNDLLTFSRISTKARPAELIHLNQLVTDVLSDLESRILTTKGQVIVENLPDFYADPLQIRQLMQNLISNALKYHRAEVPPLVRVSGKVIAAPKLRAKTAVQIFVEDNGIGFDPQYLNRIFQPFERLHGRNEYEGTGMGLAICQKIVERHHGTITANSEVDAGSTFIVTLPMQPSPNEQEEFSS